MTILEETEKNSITEELESIKQLRLESLLQQRHSEFMDVMYSCFGLKERPRNIPVNFTDTGTKEGFLCINNKKNRIEINKKFIKESIEENLGIELITPHETAHYLHAIRQPEFYIKNYKDLTDRERRYLERIAELATLVFLDESGRGGAEQYFKLNMKSLKVPVMPDGHQYWPRETPSPIICTWISNMDKLVIARKRLQKMVDLSRSEFELIDDHDLLHKVVLYPDQRVK